MNQCKAALHELKKLREFRVICLDCREKKEWVNGKWICKPCEYEKEVMNELLTRKK